MAETEDSRGIRSFWPDDDENTLHIAAGGMWYTLPTLRELIQQAEDKWGEGCWLDIKIEAKHIHTDCLGYDRYDPGDYTDFIVLTKISQQ